MSLRKKLNSLYLQYSSIIFISTACACAATTINDHSDRSIEDRLKGITLDATLIKDCIDASFSTDDLTVIADTFSRIADEFSDHNHPDVSAPYNPLSDAEKERLNNNWTRWYTYKIFSCVYAQREFDIRERSLADKETTRLEISIPLRMPNRPYVMRDVQKFYEHQIKIQKDIDENFNTIDVQSNLLWRDQE